MSVSSERRRAILEAATRLFEHYGHGKTTIADVAREAQVGVGTVYLEFESKDAIVQELSLSAHVGVLRAMREASEKSSGGAARLTAVLLARTRAFVALRKKGQHACELVHCKAEAVRTAHERFREDERALLGELLREGQREGVFVMREASAVAALIQRVFATLSPPWIFGSDDDAMECAIDLCNVLLHGILASNPESPTAEPPRNARDTTVSRRLPSRKIRRD